MQAPRFAVIWSPMPGTPLENSGTERVVHTFARVTAEAAAEAFRDLIDGQGFFDYPGEFHLVQVVCSHTVPALSDESPEAAEDRQNEFDGPGGDPDNLDAFRTDEGIQM